MPLNPSSPNPTYLIPSMLSPGQPASAATFNAIAQTVVDSIQRVRHLRGVLESQVTNLEASLDTAGPNFSSLLNSANSLNSQINNALTNNGNSSTLLTGIQSNIVTNDQNANIQISRLPALTALIDSLTIGGEVQSYSDLLNRIANATLTASRVLGTDSSSQVQWRSVGSLGSGISLKGAILSRKLTDTGSGGSAPSLTAWNPIQVDPPSFNSIGIIFNNTTKEFNIPAGEYLVFGFCVGSSDGVKCRLRNITANTILAMSNPAKGSIASAVVGSQPVNFVAKMLGTFFISSQITADFQSYYAGSAAVASNTQGATSNLGGYLPQQSVLVLLRIVY